MGAARFNVGDRVSVLNAFRLPAVEEVKHVGIIERITDSAGGAVTLYWVSGLAVARTEPVLRHAVNDDHLLVKRPRRTLAEQWAEEDDERRQDAEMERAGHSCGGCGCRIGSPGLCGECSCEDDCALW